MDRGEMERVGEKGGEGWGEGWAGRVIWLRMVMGEYFEQVPSAWTA